MVRRVVVTGMGIVSPLGNDLPTTWANILAGKSGVAPITKFDATDYRTKIAAEVKDFDPRDYFDRKEVRRLDPVAQFGLVAAREAITSSGIDFKDSPIAERTAVIIGSGIGGITTIIEQADVLRERGPGRISPFLIPMILPETTASLVSIEFGLKGPCMAMTSACATGANTVGEAYEMIRHEDVDAAVCGGTEASIVPLSVSGFGAMRAISTRNDAPERASRPFDRDRDGFVVGEGAGILILETLEHALERGATIHAELVGYASNDDAYHITAPLEDGEGAAACMRQAMASANLGPEDIDYINAHGTSTPLNDVTETRAIKLALGDAAYNIPVSSTKSMTGHLLGATGAVESIFCAKALACGIVPPTMNLDNPDPECDLDYVPNEPREIDIRTAMTNSFGFGGHNVCLIFRKFEDA
ncbi:MAG: beta-ketoacyl-ACP synthase II [Chloroflexota bacterium]|nr:beta-ketoacyl-ACP synthase II [Chloroflexota bacterium]